MFGQTSHRQVNPVVTPLTAWKSGNKINVLDNLKCPPAPLCKCWQRECVSVWDLILLLVMTVRPRFSSSAPRSPPFTTLTRMSSCFYAAPVSLVLFFFHFSISPSSSVMPWARSSSRTLSRCPGSGKPWPVRLEPNSVLWWTLKMRSEMFVWWQQTSCACITKNEIHSTVWCRCARTSFQMTVSDSPVVLEVPTEKINLRSHATRSSLRTWRWVRVKVRTTDSFIKPL